MTALRPRGDPGWRTKCEQPVAVCATRMAETMYHLREDRPSVPVRGKDPLDVFHDGNGRTKPGEYSCILLVKQEALVQPGVIPPVAEIPRPPNYRVGLTRRTAQKHGPSTEFLPNCPDPLRRKVFAPDVPSSRHLVSSQAAAHRAG